MDFQQLTCIRNARPMVTAVVQAVQTRRYCPRHWLALFYNRWAARRGYPRCRRASAAVTTTDNHATAPSYYVHKHADTYTHIHAHTHTHTGTLFERRWWRKESFAGVCARPRVRSSGAKSIRPPHRRCHRSPLCHPWLPEPAVSRTLMRAHKPRLHSPPSCHQTQDNVKLCLAYKRVLVCV